MYLQWAVFFIDFEPWSTKNNQPKDTLVIIRLILRTELPDQYSACKRSDLGK